MTEPLVTLPVSDYNALVKAAQDQVMYVGQERAKLERFIFDLADELNLTYPGNPIAKTLRASVVAFMPQGPKFPPKVETP